VNRNCKSLPSAIDAFLVAEVLPLFATEAPFLAADVHPLPATEVPFLLPVDFREITVRDRLLWT
jgi:hypothetical protein